MTLREVLGAAARDAPPVEVTGLAYDNRLVAPGTLFFCVSGFTRDGHDFAPDAVARGAAALVVDVRAAMAPAAAAFHGDPTADLCAVGITGTNGKTTTAFLIRGLLEAAGRRTGLVGTVSAVVGGEERAMVRTTPEAIDLQRMFAEMRDAGDEAVVMEVSSHALQLHRADAIHWAVAIFTNLTQDHLDFHPTMEDYFAAKRRLFESDPEVAVINVDDPYGARLAREVPDAITIGIDAPAARLRATGIESDATGSSFTVDGLALRAPLPGRFNVLNALGAVAAVRALGVDDAAIAAALPHVARVPGRFEPVDEGQPFAVLVDYAHTPDSLDNVLRAARGLARGRLIVVFGAGGDRDRAKRPLMGGIASELADRVIVTTDNPRREDPSEIASEVAAGARHAVEIELDRRRAIEQAIEDARPGDVVVIAGKGADVEQEVGGRRVPFDDRVVAREALRRAAVQR